MKRIFLATILSFQFALAKTFLPGSVIRIGIDQIFDSNRFTFHAEEGDPIPFEQYFLTDGKSTWRAIFMDKKQNGLPHFDFLEKLPEDSDGRALPNEQVGIGNNTDYNGAVAGALISGTATGIIDGLILDKDFLEKIRVGINETNAHWTEVSNNIAVINSSISSAGKIYKDVLNNLRVNMTPDKLNVAGPDSYVFKSGDSPFTNSLKGIHSALWHRTPENSKQASARQWGLTLAEYADSQNANNDFEAALAAKKFASAFLDISFGLIPMTGPLRDIYESFTGRNFITNEKLSDLERGFAIAGAITFGFGSKIARGLKFFGELASRAKIGEKVSVIASKIFAWTRAKVGRYPHARGESSAVNFALHEKYLKDLRMGMEKPNVTDPELGMIVEDLWRDTARHGNGSTAAAIRYEKLTGEPVKGKWHSLKGIESLNRVAKWLKKDLIVKQDKIVAENIFKDISAALKGE